MHQYSVLELGVLPAANSSNSALALESEEKRKRKKPLTFLVVYVERLFDVARLGRPSVLEVPQERVGKGPVRRVVAPPVADGLSGVGGEREGAHVQRPHL